ncbi:sensor histidine kinase [Leptothrix discophora]|uniref:Histidine kinase n=1 Tax=Leptothrix discophora TaxID=89 RepID=A0ABT9G081_LEPDI|nr:histidine kinase [Leptothrix discophora]MDP4299893.1 histidine kinase [Leptothrix discophora]
MSDRPVSRPADVPPPRPSAPARDDADMGPTTWLDDLLLQNGDVTSPAGLTGVATGHGRLDEPPRPGDPALRTPPADALPIPRPPAGQAEASAFDVCQAGVVLRALLAVHGVLVLGLAHVAVDPADWLARSALVVAMALPATLMWLALVCALRARWERLPLAGQWAAMCGLGALCAALPWGLIVQLGLVAPSGLGVLAPLATGAALAATLFQGLQLRARLRLPASTVARLAELQSRIRPHFLFNALNSAVALVRVDPAKAEDVLEDLSELFRAALVGSGDQATLGEEVELARRYLAIEQVRFGKRLQVIWQLDAATDTARVPTLLLQPLVENAVKHGIEPAAEGGVVHVRTQAHKGQALISVTNTLPRAAETRAAAGMRARGQGMALRNVRERLMLLHDLTMRFEAGVIAADRYRVRIAVPLNDR